MFAQLHVTLYIAKSDACWNLVLLSRREKIVMNFFLGRYLLRRERIGFVLRFKLPTMKIRSISLMRHRYYKSTTSSWDIRRVRDETVGLIFLISVKGINVESDVLNLSVCVDKETGMNADVRLRNRRFFIRKAIICWCWILDLNLFRKRHLWNLSQHVHSSETRACFVDYKLNRKLFKAFRDVKHQTKADLD